MDNNNSRVYYGIIIIILSLLGFVPSSVSKAESGDLFRGIPGTLTGRVLEHSRSHIWILAQDHRILPEYTQPRAIPGCKHGQPVIDRGISWLSARCTAQAGGDPEKSSLGYVCYY